MYKGSKISVGEAGLTSEVWMVGMEEGVFPHARVFEQGKDDLEEERRLCYVGMTRAREELHLSYAASRLQFGERSYHQPSRFLQDMGHEIATVSLPAQPFQVKTADFDDEFSQIPQFDIGDRVKSLKFGTGEVIDIDGLAATIAFDNGQTRKLNTEFAHLEKLAF
jgi:DNA helicase-2/ATP-dependent DNA helicase PcrA